MIAEKVSVAGAGDRGDKNRGNVALVGWLGVFASFCILYLFTLAPDLVWQDQGDYQYQVAKCNLSRPGDVVRVHPLFIVTAHGLGRLGPWNYAYAANLTSALFTAVTVANIFLLVFALTGRTWPGILSALVCGLAHSIWFLGVQAQTYSMANAAWTGCLLCCLAYLNTNRAGYLYLMGFIAGLGLSAHMMSQVGFVVIMAWLLIRVIRKKLTFVTYGILLACWVIGAALLWYVIVLEYHRSGNLGATLLSAVYGKWGSAVFNVGQLSALIKKSFMFFLLNFPTPLLLLAGPGLWYSIKSIKPGNFAGLLAVSALAYALFAARYDVPNQNNFFLPFYLLIGIYVGLGFVAVSQSHPRRWTIITLILVLAIPPAYPVFAKTAEAKQVALGTRRHIPYRNVYQYYLIPWQQGQTGPRRLAEEVIAVLPDDAVLLPDSTVIPAFQYALEIEGKRPDIQLKKIYLSQDELRLDLAAGRRVFTFSNVKRYYPPSIPTPDWLSPFEISESEHIFEISIPGEKESLERTLNG